MIRENFTLRDDYRAGELAEAEYEQAEPRLSPRQCAMIAGGLSAALWLVIAAVWWWLASLTN